VVVYLLPDDGIEPFEDGIVTSVVLADWRGKFITDVQFDQISIIVFQFHTHFRQE
jgi:hypothetical protein